ncbi:response regulator transcription factor [Paraburkholderia bengalensis]|uniref:response regulator transcription factor n=1 Tax=Paraburkholderia bengalensis TaxID=2747562 RepID=UPI003014FA78
MRIAILQRDPVQGKLLEKIIVQAGHSCVLYDDGLALSKVLARSTVDLLVLDWHALRLSGTDVLKAVRSVGGERMPVIFASEDGSEESVVRAFVLGGDDYVTLPVRHAEFRERVTALLRRAYPERFGKDSFDVGPYHFDKGRRRETLVPRSLFNICSKFVQNRREQTGVVRQRTRAMQHCSHRHLRIVSQPAVFVSVLFETRRSACVIEGHCLCAAQHNLIKLPPGLSRLMPFIL